MQIRTRLTLQFVGIVALIMVISYLAIYFFSSQYRETQFYGRLRDKAQTTADLLIKVDAVSPEVLKIIDRTKKDLLYKEDVTVYNEHDQEIYTSNDTISFHTNKSELELIRLKGERMWTEDGFEIVGIEYVYRSKQFVVVAGAADRYGFGKLKNLRDILTISFVLILAVVAVTGWIYAGRSLRPISRIVDQVNTISGTSLNTRLDEGNRTDEIARLSATFNEMLDRIESSFQLQKSFVANASHELKNPLTIITSQLEVILLRDRTPADYQKTIASVLEDLRGLNQVSLRLLDLARLNSDEIKIDFRPLRIDELIWQVKDELSGKRPDYKIIFSPELPEDENQLVIAGNEYLLKTAILNLVDNACKFSSANEAQVILRTQESAVMVEFKDDGIGIRDTDIAFIFQPFYRGANAAAINGHGIGLSLVEKIVKLHKATIIVTSSERGSTFRVTFPVA